MEHISGGARMSANDGEAESRIHLGAGPRSDPGDEGSDDPSPWERLTDAGERFGSRVANLAHAIDDRTGAIGAIRRNPLLALGVAFGTGVVIAASTTFGDRNWALLRVRKHLRAAIVAGVAAALAEEVKELLENEDGIGSLLHSFLDHESDNDGSA